MKTSFIIGWAALFISCILFQSIIQQDAGMTAQHKSWIDALMQPTGTDITWINSIPVIGEAAALITKVWGYMSTLILMIFLWFPSMWTGQWIWVYYCVFLPVSIGFVVSIVIILRGVHNA